MALTMRAEKTEARLAPRSKAGASAAARSAARPSGSPARSASRNAAARRQELHQHALLRARHQHVLGGGPHRRLVVRGVETPDRMDRMRRAQHMAGGLQREAGLHEAPPRRARPARRGRRPARRPRGRPAGAHIRAGPRPAGRAGRPRAGSSRGRARAPRRRTSCAARVAGGRAHKRPPSLRRIPPRQGPDDGKRLAERFDEGHDDIVAVDVEAPSRRPPVRPDQTRRRGPRRVEAAPPRTRPATQAWQPASMAPARAASAASTGHSGTSLSHSISVGSGPERASTRAKSDRRGRRRGCCAHRSAAGRRPRPPRPHGREMDFADKVHREGVEIGLRAIGSVDRRDMHMLTSSRRPQPVRAATAPRNSASSMLLEEKLR